MDNSNSKNETKKEIDETRKEIVKAIFIIGVCLWVLSFMSSYINKQVNTPEEIPYEKFTEMVNDDEIESNP